MSKSIISRKTYKEKLLILIQKEIIRNYRRACSFKLCPTSISCLDCTPRKEFIKKVSRLQTVRARVKATEAKHFIPNRFPSTQFTSIKLSLEDTKIIDELYERSNSKK